MSFDKIKDNSINNNYNSDNFNIIKEIDKVSQNVDVQISKID